MGMSRLRSAPAALVSGLGVALLAVAAAHHWSELQHLGQPSGPTAAFLLDAVLALGIVYAGYWLVGTGLDGAYQATVFRWCVTGGALFAAAVGLTLVIRLHEGRVITEPAFPLLVAFEAGCLAGIAAGYKTVRVSQAVARAERANRQLDALNQELQASNERLERFADTLSHDLQEPLRMVSSYLQLLEDRYGDELDEDAREYIAYAVDGADRMRSMVDGLLEYSRVTTSDDAFEPTDADRVLQTVLEDLQLRIEETDATVTTGDLPTVQANPDQLAQVFQNLLENALRHSGDDPPRVHVDSEDAGDAVRFSVRDEGVGIDPDYQDRIFGLFEQLDRTDGDTGSAGMGLALCKHIVDHHGGDIDVESTPGEGTTFTFTIPKPSGE